MKAIICAAALGLAGLGVSARAQTPPPASPLTGDWQGELKVRQDSLPIILHLGAQVTADSPAERIFGAPGKLEQTGDKYKVTFQDVGEFEGALTKDGKLSGAYTRGELTEPLVLERSAPAKP